MKKHDKEHRNWSRRQFLWTGGLATAAGLLLGKTPVSAIGASPLTTVLNNLESDRILVLINLFGGNDGLNTIIPHSDEVGNSAYRDLRPDLALQHQTDYIDNTLLSNFGPNNFALPTTMNPLMDLWNNNQMAVLHSVGYEQQNLSHFLSTKIWQAGSDDEFENRYKSGVIGRQIEYEFPAFEAAPPSIPPALQIGVVNNHIFEGTMGNNLGLVFNSPNEFYQLASTGNLYGVDGFGDCPQDDKRIFLRQVANNANRYSATIKAAYDASTTDAEYMAEGTSSSRLDHQLKIIARLIKGNLGTKVYLGYANKYDTHASQKEFHLGLLADLANNIRSFFDDLGADADRVLLMTFSEFGRTVRQTGIGDGAGTDHGNLAPIMLFGGAANTNAVIEPGFHGQVMDFNQVANGRLPFENQAGATDFRRVYATVMEQWLCLPTLAVDYILGAHYERIPNLIANPCEASTTAETDILLGHRPHPDSATNINLQYALLQKGIVRLKIMDKSGQDLHTLFHEVKTAGSHTFTFSPEEYLLSSGEYIYQLEAGGKKYMRQLVISD